MAKGQKYSPVIWGPNSTAKIIAPGGMSTGGSNVIRDDRGFPIAISPRQGFVWQELYASAVASATMNLGWVAAVSGTGAAASVASSVVNDSSHMVFHAMNTGNTTTGYANLRLGSAALVWVDDTELSYQLSVRIGNLATVGDDYTARFGIGDPFNGNEPVDGIYFEYNRAALVNWRCVTANDSTRTQTDSEVAVIDTDWVHLAFKYDGTDVKYYINGVLVCTNTTNIPSGSGDLCRVIQQMTKTAGTTSRLIYTQDFCFAAVYPSAH